jgi:hypothetical protein
VGWNGMQSHSIPRTPVELKAYAKNPDIQFALDVCELPYEEVKEVCRLV